MSYLGYNAAQNVAPSNLNIMGSLQAGQNFSEGLLKQRQMQKVADLQDQYSDATDPATQTSLLRQIAAYNPEHAKGILMAANAGIAPFGGESFKSQGANIHYQALKAKYPDMPEGILRAKAYNAALSGDNVDFGDNLPLGALRAPSLPQSPAVGQLSSAPSKAEQVVDSVPPGKMNIADHADQATPEEIQFAQEFVAQPREMQANWYAKNASAHPDLPKELTPEVKSTLYDAAEHFAAKTSAPIMPNQNNSNSDQDVERQAQAMVEGRAPYPTGMMLKQPLYQQALALAQKKDPKYDFATAAGRISTYKDITSKKSAQELEALNTSLGHYATLMDKWSKLNNGSIPAANYIGNKISSAMGDPEVAGFKQTADLLAPELIKAYGASHSQAETDKFQKNFDVDASPAQQKEVLKTGAELMQSKIAAKMARYKKGMGTVEGFDKVMGIDQAGINTLNKLGVDTTKLGLPGVQSDSSPNFGEFKEGQTATNPQTGHKITFRGGKWQ